VQRKRAHGFEIFITALNIALPISSDFPAPPPLPRRFHTVYIVIFGSYAVAHLSLKVAVLVQLKVRTKALMGGECATLAGRMGACWWMNGPDMMLKSTPCRKVGRHVFWPGKTHHMNTRITVF
jgi:hypothetical protein